MRFLTCFAAAFGMALAMLVIHALLPPRHVPDVSEKFDRLAEEAQQIDTLFIGSSRIYHQVSPAVFDRFMAEHERPTRSFNFGVKSMYPPESFIVLRRILRQRPTALNTVFIEAVDFPVGLRRQDLGTVRALYWHDTQAIALVLRSVAGYLRAFQPGVDDIDDLTRRLRAVPQHLQQFAVNHANAGALLETHRAAGNENEDEALGPARDGYSPREVEPMGRQDSKRYARIVDELDDAPPPPDPMSAFSERVFLEVAEEVRRAGAAPIFLVAPGNSVSAGFLRGRREVRGVPVFAFNNPREFPNLYDVAMRTDSDHLNWIGAERFTTELAKQFAAYLAAQAAATPAPAR